MTGYRYRVEILHLLVSPGHAYFGRPQDGPTPVETTDADEVRVVADKGIVGDRFFDKAAHLDAGVTFLSVEALQKAAADLGVAPFDPLATRRNVVLRGADLASLLGQHFALDCGDGPVCFRGGRPASPCAWMDVVLADGAHAALRGRGGLRCRPLTSGTLRRGPAVLQSPVPLDPIKAGEATGRRRPLP